MNQRKLAVLGILATLVVVFVAGLFAYQQHRRQATDEGAAAAGDRLVRMHSSVLGPQNAPVTIVEFFDPACETCRAIYPFIKEIMARARQDIDDPAMAALLRQDVEDLKALQVRATPTFFVNGRSLSSFGPDPLAQLVAEEVAKVRR